MKNYIDEMMKLAGAHCPGGPKQAKRVNKYNAQKTAGYDSKKEYRRACLLKALARDGKISDLQEQVRYMLIPPQYDSSGSLLEKSCSYVADFVYRDKAGNLVVEDVKGVRTPEYKLKKKLMLLIHGVRITEI